MNEVARTMHYPALLAASLLALSWQDARAQAVEAFYEAERVAAIAAVSNRWAGPDLPFRSGLFVAYAGADGRVEYFQDELETYAAEALSKSPVTFQFDRPTAIGEYDGMLVVWDAGDETLYRVDLRIGGRKEPLWRGAPLVAPTQIAISPEGFVLLVDGAGGSIFWTTLEGGSMNRLEGKTRSVSIAIPAWDTLAVLDREQQSLKVFTLFRGKSDLVIYQRGELSLSARERLDAGEFRALAAQDGALYIADHRRIYSYIESTGELVPAVTDDSVLGDITHLQVTYDNFYVVDGEQLRKISRTVPVEIVFDTSPHTAQTALLDLYVYLYERGLLPFEEVVVTSGQETLEQFLIERKVFAAPASAFPGGSGSFRLWPFGKRNAQAAAARNPAYTPFEAVFCEHNGAWCLERDAEWVFAAAVQSGTRLMLPKMRVQSKLGLREITLEQPVSAYLDRLVISPELRRSVDYSLLRRVNESARNLDPERFYAKSSGDVILPYEAWFVTAAVPVHEYNRDDSGLYDLHEYPGVTIYSRQVYVEQAAHSHHTPAHAAERCRDLKASHEKWLGDLNYPHDYPRFADSAVRVGVLENQSHVQKNHQIFELDPGAPTWHEVNPLTLDLVPQPQPASFAGGAQVVGALDVFSRNLHHGTHVAALLGGRRGSCWSGLLPRSQLMLIDTSAAAAIQAGLFDARRAFISVLNVSQKLADDPSFHTLLRQRHRSQIFVLASGNNGVDLNVDDDDSAVKWGGDENIIVVTAIDDAQQPIGPTVVGGVTQPGVNTGKRFVDLAAPGAGIVSATGERSYGAASGTSQAAPAVAVAAAYLADEEQGWGRPPGAVKARLIATADWHDGLKDKVWGGLLNLGDAVRFPDRDLVRTHTGGMDTVFSLQDTDNAKLTIDNFPAPLYERDSEDQLYSKRDIRLQLILSLKANGDGTWRVVFRDRETHQLKIILAAQLSGRLRCARAERWDSAAARWVASTLCDQEIGIAQIKHYYKAFTYNVEWS